MSSGVRAWTRDEIRDTFVKFFVEKKGHTNVPSSPVVPHDDPTLLFANAGMNQFKPCFLGQVDPRSDLAKLKRICNTQKCIRAGGKHNDLDDVGKDTYHHTFFEMLGNWSIGDYFKKEAISWAWELLTEVYGLPKERLYATYFGGNEAQGLPVDEEAKSIWLSFMPSERVLPFGMKDNFWEMGDTGPCGPCTEIHFDRIGGRDASSMVNADDPTVIEIWNLVFIQFNREHDGSLKPLPAKHVDTGMGFERLSSILQGKMSNYDTDIFEPIFAAIRKETGARQYTGKIGAEDVDHVDTAYRVVADHIRTLSFAITDGAVPSNEGRGYVLRRVLRRGIRFGNLLGGKLGFFSNLVPTVLQVMGGAFPELRKNPDRVRDIIKEEEIVFGRTLEKGIDRFNKAAQAALKEGKKKIGGKEAFMLYDTYGFPPDLTQLMAEERGMTIDRAGYVDALEKAKDLSRAAQKAHERALVLEAEQTDYLDKHNVPITDDAAKYIWHDDITARVHAIYTLRSGFLDSTPGYQPNASSDLLAGESCGLVFDRTNYYAESGGQTFDTGRAVNGQWGTTFEVANVQQFGKYILHIGTVQSGQIRIGDEMTLKVDYERRGRIAPNHTGTHILNFALRKVLGEAIDQKGSLVVEDKLRFDFSYNKPIEVAHLAAIEEIVQDRIARALPVYTLVAPLPAAKRIGSLRAVFGETYPDPVRVVSVGSPVQAMLDDPDNPAWQDVPVEFCGGTHLFNTSQAEAFALISEEGIAKGIRRIVAFTGQAAKEANRLAEELKSRAELMERLGGVALAEEIKSLTETVNSALIPALRKKAIRDLIDKQIKRHVENEKKAGEQRAVEAVAEGNAQGAVAAAAGKSVIVTRIDRIGLNATTAFKVLDAIRTHVPSAAIMLFSVDDSVAKVGVFASVTDGQVAGGLNAKDWLSDAVGLVGGKGGGKPTGAQGQGSDVAKVSEAMDAAQLYASKRLAPQNVSHK
mmetsp:Transcript_39201/g.65438  ORF Transcript_39201/g.65438 Transcript_39201/m.65438 type:complete len:974 (+) Transcript_39201:108-3029(+)|eukprot:CAMPEP_0184649850 /NCGR_PEP_ID=MMETSP0308-20130426/7283_1 /TAXON_ID=38269 /ORGANISM="Gloeochaete witrockiana, Strain SAG 46.84" /LENGTH=973 /DNA_ID=CAMNT_0027082905 /DNA_START=40 /DNA_END=2961 /DNA_ORIENTATION=+